MFSAILIPDGAVTLKTEVFGNKTGYSSNEKGPPIWNIYTFNAIKFSMEFWKNSHFLLASTPERSDQRFALLAWYLKKGREFYWSLACRIYGGEKRPENEYTSTKNPEYRNWQALRALSIALVMLGLSLLPVCVSRRQILKCAKQYIVSSIQAQKKKRGVAAARKEYCAQASAPMDL